MDAPHLQDSIKPVRYSQKRVIPSRMTRFDLVNQSRNRHSAEWRFQGLFWNSELGSGRTACRSALLYVQFRPPRAICQYSRRHGCFQFRHIHVHRYGIAGGRHLGKIGKHLAPGPAAQIDGCKIHTASLLTGRIPHKGLPENLRSGEWEGASLSIPPAGSPQSGRRALPYRR